MTKLVALFLLVTVNITNAKCQSQESLPKSKNAIADSQNVNEVLFTLSAESKEQVDNWEKEVERVGGKIISKPEEFGKGYYGFVFADPDGHRFNVFYMEGL